jgi:hypothetical protein
METHPPLALMSSHNIKIKGLSLTKTELQSKGCSFSAKE